MNHELQITLKALASFSPGLPQPWGSSYQRILTLKALANYGTGDFANSFRVREVKWVGSEIPGLLQPWAGISQRFQRIS